MSGQSWAVLGVVALAALYLGWHAWRALRRSGSGPGCCETGCRSAGKEPPQPAGPEGPRSFLPLDNLMDLARRHKQGRDRPET